ncbi:LEF-1 [Choristoneura occidentalis granulovirus]|uniref:LEF-1 n=1 Tax=Choristoneura occidentalis granulovirus TaxID=364745 RepID=Q1A4P1_9BBAC|nr:LEF-1 [Choristoneura fumiferana granulovirus]ABC61189.1 LEF-1 [Choristoneura fumiferana granulovirus]
MYTSKQLEKVWMGVNYREDRYWAFMKPDGMWLHSDSKYSKEKTFKSFEHFEKFVRSHNVQDIHVKMLIDGSREWVIDVDHNDNDERCIKLKNMISHCVFGKFFGHNCDRIMYSGNRGLHIWLNHNDFDMRADKYLRTYYYDDMLQVPKIIVKPFVEPHSLHECFLDVFNNLWIKREIEAIYPNIKIDNLTALVKEFYPYVDKQVFVSTKQIRAPYSYNTKGKKFNCDHELLFE